MKKYSMKLDYKKIYGIEKLNKKKSICRQWINKVNLMMLLINKLESSSTLNNNLINLLNRNDLIIDKNDFK